MELDHRRRRKDAIVGGVGEDCQLYLQRQVADRNVGAEVLLVLDRLIEDIPLVAVIGQLICRHGLLLRLWSMLTQLIADIHVCQLFLANSGTRPCGQKNRQS